ncbi:MAG: ATP-binding protein, partial [Oscillospiraceae bacterium]|nr:ATP-binding protein [Oscillospiraceae bacterium]
GDKDAITQVVYNLIDNAVKFATPGSTLRLGLWKQDGRAFVSVENEGETIRESELPLIFDRFHKSDRSRGLSRDGVGLGLYIVKTILDHHNEDIFVTSRDGVTRFTFTLKLAQPKARAQA